MLRLTLTEEEQASLVRLRLKRKASIGERAWYVLLLSSGKSIAEITNQTGRNHHTIRLWIKRYLSEGIVGLQTRTLRAMESRQARASSPR